MNPKTVGFSIFFVGLLVVFMFLPWEDCRGIGFRGTFTKNTRCTYIGHYPIFSPPIRYHTETRRVQLDHKILAGELAVLFVVSSLVGLTISFATKSNK